MSGSALWTVDAMAAAMKARRDGALPDRVSGLSIDSRSIGRGEAFFAIQGDVHDGHDFAAAALGAGAGLAVVAEARRAALPAEAPLLVVPDVLAALGALAQAARARSGARVVGVTGSVGKTGTKEALRLAFASQGATHASAASFNNHWGVPLSVARMPAGARFAVFEIGMNHRRRDRAAHETGATRTSRSSPRSRRCIWSSSARSRPSPMPRRRFFPGWSPAAPQCSIATMPSSTG